MLEITANGDGRNTQRLAEDVYPNDLTGADQIANVLSALSGKKCRVQQTLSVDCTPMYVNDRFRSIRGDCWR